MTIAAIIVAAGRGKRAGAGLPKQWRKIAGTSVALHSIAAFTSHPRIDRTILVIHPDDHTQARGIESVTLVQGGATRDASVKAGLEALKDAAPALVLIHDVARPLVSARVIDDVIEALSTHPGAAPALPVTDALWRSGDQGLVAGTEDRNELFRAQTPQGFHFDQIRAAHHAHPGGAADDVEVAHAAGLDVFITLGDETNLKITTPDDFARAERLFEDRMKDR